MIHNLKNPTELSGLYFIYKGSTNLEKKGIYGLSHYGEHLKCKVFDDLQDELQNNGISYNAYTGMGQIVFFFTGLESYLAPFRDTLLERIKTFTTTEEEFEKERKIILEEYSDSFTEQPQTHYLNFARRCLGSYSPIGLREDIENVSYNDWVDFHKIQYENPDCIVNISKNFELKDNGIFQFEDRSKILKNHLPDPNAVLEPSMFQSDKTSIIWHRQIDKNDTPIAALACNMLINGLNSPLYQEVREKRGLVYYLTCGSTKMGSNGMLTLSTLTSDKKIPLLNDTITEVLSNKEKYLTQQRFDIIKKAALISKEKSKINRYNDISDILSPESKMLFDRLETLTLDEVYVVYDKYFSPDTFSKNTDKELS